MRIRLLFGIIENNFRVRKEDLLLENFHEVIEKAEELIPKRKIIKFGRNFRIQPSDKIILSKTKDVKVETFDTITEDIFEQPVDDEFKSKY